MRNLKKVLSMALAIVMMLGMMTFASAAEEKKTEAPKKVTTAADLTDMDKVTNKEAVSLLVDLKIVEGTDKGTFDPTGDVTRAVMAKLIYVAKMGSDDKAANFVGAATDLTDVKGHWAEGYINYCYSTGIVAGRGEGKFDPDAKVQAVEAAKMILVALGYDAEAQGYTDAKLWSVSIMQDAKKANLMTDVKEASNVALTRDSAAQMIFNGLFAKTITNDRLKDSNGKWYVSKVTENATTLGEEVYGLVKVSGVVNSVADGKAVFTTVSPESKTGTSMKNGVNSAKVAVANDMVGKKVVIYMKATLDKDGIYTVDKAYSSVASTGASVVLGTSMNGTPIVGYAPNATPAVKKDLTTNKSANKGYIAELDMTDTTPANYKVTSYVNGELKDNGVVAAIHADVLNAAKKNGAVVELIDADGNGKADTIKVTTKSVATLTADPSTKTVDDVLQVKVPGIVGLNTFIDAKKVVGYEDLKKNDVVLFYKDITTGVFTIEKAASVEGKVSAVKASEIQIDGTYYAASDLSGFDITTVDTENTYTFYLDNAKNIVKANKITSETSKDYAVILDAKFITGGTIGASNYGQAKLLFTDGTTEIVTIAKVGGKKVDGVAMTADQFNGLKPDGSTIAYNFYNYTTNDAGNYELTNATSDVIKSNKITNGAAAFDGTTIGNANTLFIVAIKDGDNTLFKTYTGINAVPTISNIVTVAFNSAVITKDGVATYAFLNTDVSKVEGITGDKVYFSVPDETDVTRIPKSGNVPEHFIIPVYVDGVLVKDAKFSAAAKNALASKVLYSVTTTNDSGHYTAIGVTEFDAAVEGINVVSGGTLSVGPAPAVYTYDTDTVAYYINKDGEMSTIAVSDISVDATDKILVKATNKLADVIYVQEINSNDVALNETVKVTIDGTAGTVALTGKAGGNGKTPETAITYTLTKGGVTADKTLKLEFSGTANKESAVALVAGTVPTKTATALTDVLTYAVTAENGTVCYYKITLNITVAA